MVDSQSLVEPLSVLLAKKIAGFQALRKLERLSGGASQETYRLEIDTSAGPQVIAWRREAGGEAVVRDGLQIGIANEARLWRAALAVGVPVPQIIAKHGREDGLGEGILMPWLSGQTLGFRIVKDSSLADLQPSLSFQCGQILARIHRIEITASGLTAFLPQATPRELVMDTWSRYQIYGTPQPMIDYAARWLLDHLPPPCRPALTHGDFRNGNLMVNADGIVAVLDWELTHIGDPMRDLGWLCTRSWRFGRHDRPVGGFGDYADLFAGYRAESGVEVERDAVHFWEVFGSFWWAVGCLTMADQYRNGPDRQVERPAIGRRSSECQIDLVNLLIPGPVAPIEGATDDDTNLPTLHELIASVREFLRNDVVSATRDRTQYLARVAANSLEIAERQVRMGPTADFAEFTRLRKLFGNAGSLPDLRQMLVNKLRDNTFALDDSRLIEHLRASVAAQIQIDQPNYAAAIAALAELDA
jgi:aminoglycoside phosphotransferase (APT) family kinase protein